MLFRVAPIFRAAAPSAGGNHEQALKTMATDVASRL